MGLDQYASQVKGEDAQELAYWRKHNRLQGWMEDLYARKGGEGEFNCVDLELTEEDLDELESAIDNRNLPETGGFFFGSDSYSDYEDEEWGYLNTDREFIEKAREALGEGWKVVYSCWW